MTRRGMVLGKFLPPHLGHLYLIEYAQQLVEELVVVVGTLNAEPIDGRLRYQWLCELAPHATVVHLQDENPQTPDEHPDFWAIWEASLRRVMPWTPDRVFASEPYGARLAEIFGAEFVPLDVQRSVIPVSGSAIRAQPLEHWAYLPRCVRPYYAKRVSLFGPESTGKTTLANALGTHYQTVVVPEIARGYLQAQQGQLNEPDMLEIAKRQRAAENALARSAQRLLICDTDPLLTCAWSRALFGQVSESVRQEAAAGNYALTFMCDIDVPFEPDMVRYLPHQREAFRQQCRDLLVAQGRHYVELRGTQKERLRAAIRHIDEWLR